MQLELIRHGKCMHLTPQFEGIIRHVFYICNRELDLISDPAAVQVEFGSIPIAGAGAATDPTKKNPYSVIVDIDGGALQLIHSLTHEMVHVAQIARGHLTMRGHRAYWKGEPTFVDEMARLTRKYNTKEKENPHEVEAYKIGPEIYEKYLKEVSHKDLLFICSNSDKLGDPKNMYSNLDSLLRLKRERETIKNLRRAA